MYNKIQQIIINTTKFLTNTSLSGVHYVTFPGVEKYCVR